MDKKRDERLGSRIRRARQERGITQKCLADRVGISPQGLNMIETNKTPDPAASRVREIARVLRVRADYLLGLSEKMDAELVPALASYHGKLGTPGWYPGLLMTQTRPMAYYASMWVKEQVWGRQDHIDYQCTPQR